MSAAHHDETPQERVYRHRYIIAAAVSLASMMQVIDTSIVNVAIPDVMGAFGISQVDAQWLSTGFLAAMTATMLLTDWADRAFGQRGTILASLALFMGGSVLGGIAPARAVFLDDAEGNVRGAREAGMHAILVGPDPMPALAELDRILASS